MPLSIQREREPWYTVCSRNVRLYSGGASCVIPIEQQTLSNIVVLTEHRSKKNIYGKFTQNSLTTTCPFAFQLHSVCIRLIYELHESCRDKLFQSINICTPSLCLLATTSRCIKIWIINLLQILWLSTISFVSFVSLVSAKSVKNPNTDKDNSNKVILIANVLKYPAVSGREKCKYKVEDGTINPRSDRSTSLIVTSLIAINYLSNSLICIKAVVNLHAP